MASLTAMRSGAARDSREPADRHAGRGPESAGRRSARGAERGAEPIGADPRGGGPADGFDGKPPPRRPRGVEPADWRDGQPPPRRRPPDLRPDADSDLPEWMR